MKNIRYMKHNCARVRKYDMVANNQTIYLFENVNSVRFKFHNMLMIYNTITTLAPFGRELHSFHS